MNSPAPNAEIRLGVVGAGPVGLSLALMAQARWPAAVITVYDSRATEPALAQDARTLALSLGSVQTFERLGVWPAIQAQAAPIQAVHVSQAQPALLGLFRPRAEPQLWLRAAEQRVPMLGAVAAYGDIVMPLRAAWQACCEREPERCLARYGVPVSAITPKAEGVELDAGVVDNQDLVVIAEGGVFADQARKAVHHDYQQTAWVGRVRLSGGLAGAAFERFTLRGPLALLPLPGEPGQAALVWCVDRNDDPVQDLDEAQRCAVLNSLLPAAAGRVLGLSPLKAFPLGLNAEKTLVQGRCVRIGNAAQTLHPRCERTGASPGCCAAAGCGFAPARMAPRARPLGHDCRHRFPGAQLHLAVAWVHHLARCRAGPALAHAASAASAGSSDDVRHAVSQSTRCCSAGSWVRMRSVVLRSNSARTVPSPSGSMSSTLPQGSITMEWPQVRRPFSCKPPCALAST